MRTVGEILKEKRQEKRLNLDLIEKKIKIRSKFLIALEENNWENLPSLPYIKGFIKSYSALLGLNPSEMIAIFRRQFLEKEKKGLLPEGLSTPINGTHFRLSPQIAFIGAFFLFLLVFFGYIFSQYRSLTAPPHLEISSPKEGEIIKGENIKIFGKTDPDATVSVNNEKIAINNNGEFSTVLSFSPGINTIIIEAVSKQGKKKEITRTISIE